MNVKKMVLAAIILTSVEAIVFLPSACTANWETVTTITGSADQTTNTFSITAQEWRLQWSYTPDPKFPSLTFFGVLVYPQGEGATYVDSFYVNGSTQTSGTELIHKGMNNYHLEILDANIPSYTIIVQQYGDITSNSPNGNSDRGNATNIVLVATVIAVVVIVVVLLSKKRKNHAPTQPPTAPVSNSMTIHIQKLTGNMANKNQR